MNSTDFVVLIPLGVLLVGFVYFNFIFSKKKGNDEINKPDKNRAS